MARTRNTAQTADAAEDSATGEDKMILKLVGAETYHCHRVRDDVITRNEVIEVSPEVGNILLDDTFRDGLNNEHPYFVETSDEEESAKARRASRRASKASASEPEGSEGGEGNNE